MGKKPHYKHWRAPLIFRRFPWVLLGIIVCIALLHFIPAMYHALSPVWPETSETSAIPEQIEITEMAQVKHEVSPSPEPQNVIEDEDAIQLLEYEVMSLVNGLREIKGIPLLVWDDELHKYAREHSEAMALEGALFHTDINMPYAENAWGGVGIWEAVDIVESWYTSPEHRTWLLNPNLKHVAVGIVISESDDMYASWTFWRNEAQYSDWWYLDSVEPPDWWY